MNKKISSDEQFIINIFQKYLNSQPSTTEKSAVIFEESQNYYANINTTAVIPKNQQQHQEIVNTILAMLPQKEYIFFMKQYVKPEKNWWKSFYSYQEFQKLKHDAIKRFLYLYLV